MKEDETKPDDGDKKILGKIPLDLAFSDEDGDKISVIGTITKSSAILHVLKRCFPKEVISAIAAHEAAKKMKEKAWDEIRKFLNLPVSDTYSINTLTGEVSSKPEDNASSGLRELLERLHTEL